MKKIVLLTVLCSLDELMDKGNYEEAHQLIKKIIDLHERAGKGRKAAA